MANPLHRTQLHRPWAVWLAVLVAVFSALAPTVSHALALSHRITPMEASYCSSEGLVQIAPDSAGSPDSTGDHGPMAALVHCPFCLHATDRQAPPPHPLVCPLLVQGRPFPTSDLQPHCIADVSIWMPLARGPPGIFFAN